MTDFEKICSFEVLYLAHINAKKGRSRKNKQDVIVFELNFAHNLATLQEELRNKTYRMKGYYHFKLYEPKQRDVYAVRHIDKIVMHALCEEVLIPRLSSHFIYDNAACQKGKGTHFALKRFTKFLAENFKKHGQKTYVLKCDISKYFASINHDALKAQIAKRINDEKVLDLLIHYIDSYNTHGKIGMGIPLGNQTSQWFALFYLSDLDHFIKETLRIKGYIRYMDDFVLVHHDKLFLRNALAQIKRFINSELKLELNPKTDVFKASSGVEFLGWRFFVSRDGKIIRRLKKQSKIRYKKKLSALRSSYGKGEFKFLDVSRSIASYNAHLSHGHTYYLKQRNMNKFSLERYFHSTF